MPKEKIQFTVTSNEFVTPTTFLLRFKADPSFEFIAGQFVSIIIPGAGPKGRDLRRAYSIASTPEDQEYELCIKKVEGGPGTTYLSALKAGDHFTGLAPYGDFVYQTSADRIPCFISTGTGLAPFRCILESKAYKEKPAQKAICIFGTTHENEILYQEDLNQIQNLDFVICLSREENTDRFKGRVTHYIKEHLDQWDLEKMDFYLCGNGDMIKEVKENLNEKNVSKGSIFQEKYY